MNTASALRFTKLLGYLTMTANGIINLTTKVATKATDVVLDRRRYKVEILIEGCVVNTFNQCTTKKVQEIMSACNQLHITELIIKQENLNSVGE